MPTATKTRRAYRFGELGPKGKAAAIEWYRRTYSDDPCDGVSDLLESDLSDHYGVTGCEVAYSLGHCQGDGASFTGDPNLDVWAEHDEQLALRLNVLNALTALYSRALDWEFSEPQLSVSIRRTSNHYYHEHSTTLNLEWYDCPQDLPSPLEEAFDDLRTYLEEAVVKIGRDLAATGYAEIEYRDSDEYISEHLSGNDDNDWFRWTRSGVHCG